MHIADLLIYINATFLIVLVSIKISKQLYAQLAVFTWTSFNILFLYYFFATQGGSDPKISVLGLEAPLFASVIISALNLSLFNRNGRYKNIRQALGLAIIAILTLMRYIESLNVIITGSDSELTLTLYASTFIIPFHLCVLAPITAFVGENQKSIFKSLFLIDTTLIRQNAKTIVLSSILFLAVLLLGNIIINNKIIHLVCTVPLRNFVVSILTHTFYFVLIDHFVFIAIPKRLMDSFFPGEETSWLELILYAGLFAGFHYYYIPLVVFQLFLFGLIFGYLYIKTRSLAFSIVLSTFHYQFTI